MQSAYKLVTTWFTSLEANGQPFPSNFNFSFYLKALTISLEMTDHSIVTTRVLWHIYKTLQYLPLDYKTQVIQELLKKHFFRFFFHWSNNIRYVFNLIILYQLDFHLLTVEIPKYFS